MGDYGDLALVSLEGLIEALDGLLLGETDLQAALLNLAYRIRSLERNIDVLNNPTSLE